MNLPIIIAAILFPTILAGAGYLIFFSTKAQKRAEKESEKQKSALKREAYEAEILRELSQRFGYELDEEKIVDIIAGSINKLFSYSTVGSIIFQEEKLKIKIHLEESVSNDFITKVKEIMMAALEALTEAQTRELIVDEQLTGTIVNDKNLKSVGSFFNIPIVINEKLTGIINISSTITGLYQEEEMTILYKIVSQASTAVTKLRQVLETEKGKLTAMVESMSEGVAMIDNQGKLLVMNPTAKRFLKIEEEEPSMFHVLKSIQDKLDLQREMQEAKNADKLITIDELILPDNVVQLFIAPVKDNKSEIIGIVLVLHDISKEKELERLREDFTAMMVHELRAPLTAVRGASDAILTHEQTFTADKKKEYLQMIGNSSKDMLGIVNDLLDVAKIEAGKFKVTKGSGDLTELVKEKVEAFKPVALEKQLELNLELSQEEIKTEFDALRIGQVLSNLLSNAIKFTDKGKITVSLTKNNEEVQVSVKDTGVGVKPEDQKRLFSKFSQLATKLPRTAEGTGLGLVIAKGIVESHGGKIWVESGEGEGSTFFFTIPFKRNLK
jgi:signal transduction histidine kinase